MKSRRDLYRKEIAVIILLLASPLIFYFYLFFPETSTIEFFGVKITSYSSDNLEIMFWWIFIKLNLIVVLSLWFFYSRLWWRYAILPILCYTIFQLITSIVLEMGLLKSFERINYIFILIIIIPIYIKLDGWIAYNPLSINDKIEQNMNETLISLIAFDKKAFSKAKNDLSELQKQKHTLSEKNYLISLMAIQESLNRNTGRT